jgi:GT2 family glycosyltransferase
MSKHTLSIILVNYNGGCWLKQTLTSLQQYYLNSPDTQVTVYLVDNASIDNSVATVKTDFPFVKLIEAAQNLGFAGGNNLALSQVDTDYIMLLNSDTQLDERNGIDDMLDYLATHPQAGMIGPKLILTNGDPDPACHRGEPTPWASFTYFCGLETLFPHVRFFAGYHRMDLNSEEIHPIDAISGAAMIFTKCAFEKVGLMDEQFFLYAEDLDYTKRFRDAGYQIIYYPMAVIIHHKHKSGIDNPNTQIKGSSRQYFYHTMLQYYDKHYAHKYPRWVRKAIKTFIAAKSER